MLAVSVLEEVEELIRGVEERVRQLASPLPQEGLSNAGFVDGSYALEERRGAYLLALSVSSVVYRGDRVEKVLPGSSRPLLWLLVPKSHGESRAGQLMTMLELLAAIDLARRGLDAVVLDGSFTSEMMVPFGHARDVHEEAVRLAGFRAEAAEEAGEKIYSLAVETASRGDPLSAARALLSGLLDLATQLYRELASSAPDLRGRKEALDYAVVFAETTAYLALLEALLEAARSSSTALVWVAKDAESRYIVEREGLLGWLNDLSLLDYAWRGSERAYTLLEGVRFGRPKPCAAWSQLVSRLFHEWGEYGVCYFKLARSGPVMQATFPRFVSGSAVARLASTLASLSDQHGYPRPLSYVHHTAVLNPELAQVLADEMYRRASNPLVRSVLAPSGRALAGLRR